MFRKAVAAGAGVLAGVGLFALSGLAYPALPAPTAVERLQPGALPLPRMPDGGVKVDTTPVRLVIPSIKVDATKTPKQMDAISTEKEVMSGIYELNGDNYKVCFAPVGTDT